jgi:predicted nucleic acid-binding protein
VPEELRGLLDTSVIIDYEHVSQHKLPLETAVTVVTLAELSAGPHSANDPRERGRRQRQLEFVESTYDPLPFDAKAAREYGAIVAAAVAVGRAGHRRRALDLMIAATARANRLPLYTCNPSDFSGLEDLVEIVAVDSTSRATDQSTPEMPRETEADERCCRASGAKHRSQAPSEERGGDTNDS